MLIWTK